MENKKESFGNKNEIERPSEGASDMEIALFFARHIDNPCETEVAPGKKENIRALYLREAKNALAIMAEESAKKFLELKIKEYEGG